MSKSHVLFNYCIALIVQGSFLNVFYSDASFHVLTSNLMLLTRYLMSNVFDGNQM